MPNFLPDGSVYLTKEEYSVIAQTHKLGEEAKAAVLYVKETLNIVDPSVLEQLRLSGVLFDEFEHIAREVVDKTLLFRDALRMENENI